MAGDVEAIVRRYWQRIWLDGDLDVLDELMTDPSTRHTVNGTETLTVAELRAHLREAMRAIRSTDVRLDALTVDGNTAWVRLTLKAVSLATMTPMTITWIAQYRIVGAQIAESWGLHQPGVDWATDDGS